MPNTPNTPNALGVGLWDLSKAGTESVPALAKTAADSNIAISKTFGGEDTAFTGCSSLSSFIDLNKSSWSNVRDDLQNHLYDLTETLQMLGEALCLCVTTYQHTDTKAAAALQSEMNEHRANPPKHVSVPNPIKP